ncbi:MAG: AfsR/SARP family transcriptional regulator [Actinomycetota bacterium]
MEPLWRVELLGGLRAVAGSREVTRFQSRQTGYLLAYLAYFSHRAHPREELIEILWPECEPEMGRGRLNQAVYSLRRQLTVPGVSGSEVLQSDRETLRVSRAHCTTDVAELEAALSAAKEGSSLERLGCLRNAMHLYRGELLPGCYGEWCLTERELLTERCIQALQQLTALLTQERDFDGALAAARRAVALDPIREESYRTLMRVTAAAGQLTTALQQYAELELILREQLGQRPSARAQQLAQEIRDYQEHGPPSAPLQARSVSVSGRREVLSGIVTFLVADLPPGPGAAPPGDLSLREIVKPLLEDVAGRPLLLRPDRVRIVFARATEAQRGALAFRQAVTAVGARLRLALHTGETRSLPSESDEPVTGFRESPEDRGSNPALERTERLLLAAHPGQALVSEATASLLREGASASPAVLTDLGVFRLRDSGPAERVFQLGAVEEAGTFPPLHAASGCTGHVPVAATRFIGREPELAELETRLNPSTLEGRPRHWTVTGPGGTGKTRLALEIAARLVPVYQGAVWFVALEDAVTGEQLAGALRDVLRLERLTGTQLRQALSQALSRQPVLLVLDNFEQIDSSGVSLLQELLDSVPGLTALVTSRRRLGLPGEREFPLSSLPLPEVGGDPQRVSLAESVRLFVDRAQAVRPDFQVTRHNAAPIAELCRRLEGLPLALELAAARTQVLTPAQMLAQLEQRFRFLATSRPNVGPRHRSMQAALDWGYSLLSPPLRMLYSRLSVFRGGWTLEAITELGATGTEASFDPIEGLTELRESSLVVADEAGEGMRFRMLEMIRQHATLKLQEQGEDAAWRNRHLDWFLALAESAEPELRGADQAYWLNRLESEGENLRAALEWSLEQGAPDAGLRLAVALCRFWEVRGHLLEGRRLLERALAQAPDADPLLRAKALNRAGILAREQGDLEAAESFGAQCLERYREMGDLRGVAYMLNNLGTLARLARDYARALDLYGASLELQRQRGDEAAAAVLLNNLGCLAQDQGDYPQARTYHEQSLALQRRLQDRGGIALSLNNLADVARWSREPVLATELARQSLALFRELGDKSGAAASLHIRGEAALQRDDASGARSMLRESVELFREVGDLEGLADSLDALAATFITSGEEGVGQAAVLLSASQSLRELLGSPFPPNVREQHDHRLEIVRTRLGNAAFAAAQAKGRSLNHEQAAEFALGLAGTSLTEGN